MVLAIDFYRFEILFNNLTAEIWHHDTQLANRIHLCKKKPDDRDSSQYFIQTLSKQLFWKLIKAEH